MRTRIKTIASIAVTLGFLVGWLAGGILAKARIDALTNENTAKVSLIQLSNVASRFLEAENQQLKHQLGVEQMVHLSHVPTEAVYDGKTYKLREIVLQASQDFDIPVSILVALGRTESNWDCSVIGADQDTGCLQIIPSTGAWAMRRLGIEGSNLLNPLVNVRVGAWVLKTYSDQEGDWARALAAFNAGPGAWDRAPMVSRGYAARVLSKTVESPKNMN